VKNRKLSFQQVLNYLLHAPGSSLDWPFRRRAVSRKPAELETALMAPPEFTNATVRMRGAFEVKH
jgi:hypothetical protein